jgi:hypothetical protein
MDLAIITFSAFACSAAMSIVAFMVGRCSRRLPVDGLLLHAGLSRRFLTIPLRACRRRCASYAA